MERFFTLPIFKEFRTLLAVEMNFRPELVLKAGFYLMAMVAKKFSAILSNI